MRRFLDTLYLWSGYAAAGCLVIIFLIMMIMAVGREFNINIPSGDDFAAWAMAAMAFLGMAHTFKRGEMIRVGLLLERLSGRTRHAFEALALIVALSFLLFFSWHAFRFVRDSYLLHDMSNGVVAVPLWIPQMFFFTGLAILTIAVADELVHVLKGNKPTFEKDPPKTTEELIARVAEGGGV
jgi:TRAP-type C4-dicarboxylate transport system permease small subunit